MHDWSAYVRASLPPLAVGPQRESEIVAELALQLEQAYAAALASGASEAEALGQARSQFADWGALAREIDTAERPVRGGVLAGAWPDIRYAARFLGRNPAFAAIAIGTLAFGIGGNTAIFTMVDAVALRSLPYREPASLMAIETRKSSQPEIEPWTSAPDFFDIRERTRAFSTVAAISPVWSKVLTGYGEAEQVDCLYVSADFFPMLGVSASLGRTFLPQEDNRTEAGNVGRLVALLLAAPVRRQPRHRGPVSHPGWPSLHRNRRVAAGLPLCRRAARGHGLADRRMVPAVRESPRRHRQVSAVPESDRPAETRLFRAQASDEIQRIGLALAEQYPDVNRGFADSVQPLAAQVTGRFRVAMLLLLGAVGFVLLMACANVANLLLARASARAREISVRAALGASRFRLVRQLLAEGAVLAVFGGAAGMLLAYLGLQFLLRIAPPSLVRAGEVSLDARALLFTTAAVALCALLAGLPPAWRVVRADIETALREAGRSLTAGRHRLRSALVVVQVAVALAPAGGRRDCSSAVSSSFWRSTRASARRTSSRSRRRCRNPPARRPQRTAIYRAIRDRLAAVPGVEDVAAVSRLPLMGSNLGVWMFLEGRYTPGEPGHDVEYRVATPNYFAAMGIPLRAGRLFDDHDDANPGAVLLINETAARKYWPGEVAVGKRVKLGAPPERSPLGHHHRGGRRHPAHRSGHRAPPRSLSAIRNNPLSAPILVIRIAGRSCSAGRTPQRPGAVGECRKCRRTTCTRWSAWSSAPPPRGAS